MNILMVRFVYDTKARLDNVVGSNRSVRPGGSQRPCGAFYRMAACEDDEAVEVD